MWFLIAVVFITLLSIYYLDRLDGKHPLSDALIFVVFFGVCIIPSLILFLVLEYYEVIQEYKIIPITLPLFLMAATVVWADSSKTKISNTGGSVDKKDDLVAEAIILTAVLSDDEKSESSNDSSSSSSSNSSNSDDLFFL